MDDEERELLAHLTYAVHAARQRGQRGNIRTSYRCRIQYGRRSDAGVNDKPGWIVWRNEAFYLATELCNAATTYYAFCCSLGLP